MRGLSFHGDFALIGISKPRDNKMFTVLALDDNLKKRQAKPRCGLQVVDLRTGDSSIGCVLKVWWTNFTMSSPCEASEGRWF